jgi:hypothetical protein
MWTPNREVFETLRKAVPVTLYFPLNERPKVLGSPLVARKIGGFAVHFSNFLGRLTTLKVAPISSLEV